MNSDRRNFLKTMGTGATGLALGTAAISAAGCASPGTTPEESDDPVAYAAMLADLSDSILKGVKEQECPQCGNTLRCRVQEGLDIDEQPIYLAKAFCQKCPFILK